jgi:endonuclease YncB( thermonuclease family)
MKSCVVAALLLATAWCVQAEVISGKVVRVADGDTITVLDEQMQQHKIRLAGIDAPERRQAFGQRSREFLSSLVAAQQVEVETEKTDKYGRSVGKVLLQGRDMNLAVVAAGLAWHYKEYESEQSPSDRLLYANAEQEARVLRKGLWVDPAPEAPWDWRHNGGGR